MIFGTGEDTEPVAGDEAGAECVLSEGWQEVVRMRDNQITGKVGYIVTFFQLLRGHRAPLAADHDRRVPTHLLDRWRIERSG